mmetsp:Transcript_24832/g.37276  ORF Transcript_24832/g.37276 Transcript_24832/m.37276 type:complete len:443 (+) Transcript_24832:58-1386(+)
MANSRYWLATFPNEHRVESQTHAQIAEAVASSKHDYCTIHQFDMPALLVGTLDSLISLSDDLTKVDMACEQAVRKIERQFHEISPKDSPSEPLSMSGRSVEGYLQEFVWDFARYPHRRPLPELVGHIQTSVGQVDEELKNLAAAYTEKTQLRQALQRKKGGNLLVADLADVLTAERLEGVPFHDTEHLHTVVVVLNKQNQREFEEGYERLGAEIGAFGGPDWTDEKVAAGLGRDDGNFGPESARAARRGSPVVPGSAQLVLREGDYLLYAMTVLKGHYEAGFVDEATGEFQPGRRVEYFEELAAAAKNLKFTVRRFTFDPDAAGAGDRKARQLDYEVDQLHSGIGRWCRAHYPEALEAWVHLKVIRAFVESILRYGLPRNFCALVLRPRPRMEGRLEKALQGMFAHVGGGALGGGAVAAVDEGEERLETFVCQKFQLQAAGP